MRSLWVILTIWNWSLSWKRIQELEEIHGKKSPSKRWVKDNLGINCVSILLSLKNWSLTQQCTQFEVMWYRLLPIILNFLHHNDVSTGTNSMQDLFVLPYIEQATVLDWCISAYSLVLQQFSALQTNRFSLDFPGHKMSRTLGFRFGLCVFLHSSVIVQVKIELIGVNSTFQRHSNRRRTFARTD